MSTIVNLLKTMLENKKEIVESIILDMDSVSVNIGGLPKFIERAETAGEADLRNQVKVMAKIMLRQQEINRRLLLLALVYAQSDHIDAALGQALIKMGHGEEALKMMYKAKMGA